jgi:hypothetical protein
LFKNSKKQYQAALMRMGILKEVFIEQVLDAKHSLETRSEFIVLNEIKVSDLKID